MSEKYYRSKLDCMFSFIVMRYFSVTSVVMNIINLNNKSTRLIHLDALMIVVLYKVKGWTHRFPTLPSVHPWFVIIMVRYALFHDKNYWSEKTFLNLIYMNTTQDPYNKHDVAVKAWYLEPIRRISIPLKSRESWVEISILVSVLIVERM